MPRTNDAPSAIMSHVDSLTLIRKRIGAAGEGEYPWIYQL